MPLKPVESYPSGGVDSRSNPISMPPNRWLQVQDLWPQQDGSFRLRDGYTLMATGLQPGVPIHSIVSVTGPAPTYTPLIVFWQGTVPYVCDPATSIVTTPTVRGTPVASSSRFAYFYANGHLHAFNGTDAKWFDGVQWRDIGLPTLTAAQAAAIQIAPGFAGIPPAQAAGVTLTFGSGGNWPSRDVTGELVYVAFFDESTNTVSPAALAGSGYPVIGAAGQKLVLNYGSIVSGSLIILTSITQDGGTTPSYCSARGSGSAATALPGPSTITASGTTATVNSTGHGLNNGDVVFLNTTVGLSTFSSGPKAVTLVDANHFSFQDSNASRFNGGTAAIYQLLLTGTINNYQWVIPSFTLQTTGIVSLPGSSIGGAQPGYEFFLSIYNRTTGHIGNRSQIGLRLANSGPLGNVTLTGLPVFADSEWALLIGRTSDGAELPHAIIDQNANWQFVPHGQVTFTLRSFAIDGNSELPSRNYPPPGALDYNYQLSLLPGGAAQNPPVSGTFSRAWVESDHCCGVIDGQATIYRSGSAQDMREGQFVGLPEQSWDPADIETFPTGLPITSGHGYQQESWVYTSEDSGVLMELAGETQWQGPYNEGACGQHAWTRGWKNMPFWISGRKQLCTISQGGYEQMGGMMQSSSGGPIAISEEYEAALLAQIGDAYLAQTEVVYIRIPSKKVDVLRIKALDSSGNTFTVIHDFNMRDDRSPYGQAYQENFAGPLQLAFTQAAVRDANSISQIVAGGSDGNLYLLYSGGADQGQPFTAQALALVYIGPQRTGVKFIEWYGDSTLQIFISRKLSIAFDPTQMTALCTDAPTPVQGEEDNNHWIVDVPVPEMIHAYVLLKLASHQADGNMNLNTPPHIPVENYGRIWLVAPQLGGSRPK